LLRDWTSHEQFQQTLVSNLSRLGPEFRERILHYRHLILKVYQLNLDPALKTLSPFYSPEGRPALYQAELLRSLVVMSHLHVDSIPQWVGRLESDSVLRTICGFPKHYRPGIGNFYDFMHRSWAEPLPDTRSLRAPYKKPRKKPKGGEKLPPKHSGVVNTLVDLALNSKSIKSPEAPLQALLIDLAVTPSARLNLLGRPDELILAGDGTPLPSGANHRGVKVCNCVENKIFNCNCHRRFSDPNARWGWDSYRKQWFYGYSLYSYTAADSPNDLPVFFTMAQGNRHDSVLAALSIPNLIPALKEMTVSTLIGDSAHDAIPIYRLCVELGINPVIDLNSRNEGSSSLPGPVEITEDGIPVCLQGYPMVNWGFCRDRMRNKWRCPLACGKVERCPHLDECSPSPYGRVLYTYPQENYRLFTPIPRGSRKWKTTYEKRTGVERTNKRTKVDYALENTRARTKCHLAWRVLLSFLNQHADAWLHANTDLDLPTIIEFAEPPAA
jgi:hypothetical protein